ncbi:MAG: DUF1761 domain-containing protein [Minisyncoccia bacterium]
MYVNILSVIVAAIVGLGIGAAWYSTELFGAQWVDILGTSWHDSRGAFAQRKAIAMEFVSMLVMAFVLFNFAAALNVHGPLAAIRLAVFVWLGFQATVLFSSVLFERRPMRLFYITVGERLVATLAMALIVGLWH